MKGMNKSYEQTVAALHYLKEKEYWLNKFSGQWTKSSFPYDHNRTNNEGGEKIVQFQFTGEVFFKLMKLSNGSDQRLYMILTAVLTVLLHRYTGSSDIIIGTPSLKQDSEAEFINTLLILRNPAETRMTFKQLLFQVRQDIIEATENQNYPVDTLPRQLNISYLEEDGFPLFDVAILVENIHHKTYIEHLRFNTLFSFSRTEEQVGGKVEFNTEVYHPRTMERITTHFKRLLESFLEDVNTRLSEVEMLSGEEKQKLLQDFNNTAAQYPYHYPGHKNVCQLFREQVERGPGNTVLVASDGSQISYRELGRKSSAIAGILDARGVGANGNSIVAIMMERSIHLVIGMLGILEAGGAYLPIDSTYPEERVHYMLKDSGVNLLLMDKSSLEKKPGMEFESGLAAEIEIIDPTDETIYQSGLKYPQKRTGTGDLFYVVYTSGSTGRPKGVLIGHTGFVNMIYFHREIFAEDSSSRMSQVASTGFDAMAFEIWPCLTCGGSLYFADNNTRIDPFKMKEWLINNQITISYQPTILAQQLLKENWPLEGVALKALRAAGDKLTQYPDRPYPFRFYNLYGPTESTVWTTWTEVETDGIGRGAGIGRPIANHQVYILAPDLQLLPISIPGELCIGGVGLARGYLNRPELTNDKFIDKALSSLLLALRKTERTKNTLRGGNQPGAFQKIPEARNQEPGPNPLTLRAKSQEPGAKLYKTGDLAKWLPDGNIQFLGRLDHQVKIRGFRIEPEEIETQLLKHKEIKNVVVLVREDDHGNKNLAAYIVMGKELNVSEIRQYLSARLPDYMVPMFFVEMKEIPLTANGKVDRKKLIGMGHLLKLEVEYLPPRDKTEKKLVEIWKNLLKIEKVGIMDSFFNIGGDSIKTINLLNIINKEFDTNFEVVELYENETIEKIANKIEKSKIAFVDHEYKNVHRELAELKNRIIKDNKLSKDIDDIYPLSEIEKGMIYYSLKDMSSSVYHDQIVFQVKEEAFDDRLLKRSLALMVQKHSLLRSGYNMFDFEEPVHIVYGYKDKEGLIDYEHIDISDLDRDGQEEYINTILEKDRENTFVFNGEKPVWRMRTAARDNENICFIWTCHHAMIDGWSTASLMTELNNTYWQLRKEVNFVPGMLESSYKDFVIQQTTWKRKSEAMDYWKNELGDYKRFNFPGPPGIEKQNDPSRGKKTKNNHLDLQLLQQLKEVAIKYNTNIKDLCFGAYVYMLNMLSYENDIVVGLVTNNRPVCEDGDKIIGCFLNTVPVRIIIPNNISWKDLIYLVREKILELKKYDKLSLFEIVHGLGEQTQGRNPIFDTIFNYIDFHVYGELKQSSVNGDIVEGGDGVGSRLYVEGWNETNTWFDFTVDVTMGTFRLLIKYSNWAVDDEMVNLLCNYFKRILIAFVHEPESLTGKNKIISPREKQKILYEFNDNRSGYPKDKTLHGLFREQAARTPDITAIVGRGQSLGGCHTLTYREFNERANQLACFLIEKGVKPGTIVGILVERTPQMLIGLLGILKAGAAYLPLDPEYPEARIKYIVEKSSITILLTQENLIDKYQGAVLEGEIIDIFAGDLYREPCGERRSRPGRRGTPTDPAYVIYTSGSTGNPKGVIVHHKNAVNFIIGMTSVIDFSPGKTILALTTISFDIFLLETLLPVTCGLKVVIAVEGEQKDPQLLKNVILNHQVEMIQATPSRLQLLLSLQDDLRCLAGVRELMVGGEAFPPPLFETVKTHFQGEIYNVYGPTETTVWSTAKDLSHSRPHEITIGRPIANTRVYIVNKNMQLQPIGANGELWIGGDGAALGYLDNVELTAKKFINYKGGDIPGLLRITNKKETTTPHYPITPLPHTPIYMTGDLARWLPNGELEFLGRMDHQVKIRGFRIELGEIESQLLKHEDIKEAVVLVRQDENKNKYLCAFIISDIETGGTKLRDYLSIHLPDYMIPSYFMQIEKIPLTSNGKIDRKGFPESEVKPGVKYSAPTNEIEEKLVELWSEILGTKKEITGIDANFFELGGHSLKATLLAAKIDKELSVKVPLAAIFRNSTIRKLAGFIKGLKKDKHAAIEPVEQKEYYALSSAQKRLYILQQMTPENTAYNIPASVVLEGKLHRQRLEQTFRQLITRHESLRTSFAVIQGNLVQRVHDEVEFEIEFFNAKSTAQGAESKAYELSAPSTLHPENTVQNFVRPFDLNRALLLRVGLIREDEAKHLLMIDMHHIISDGTSHEIFARELMTLYGNRGEELPALRLQYKDFSGWHNSDTQKKAIIKQEGYWKNQFSGEIPVLHLPTDYPRPAVQSFAGGSISFQIQEQEATALNQLALAQGTSLYMVLLALYTIFLAKITGQQDIVVGTPIAGRRHADLQQFIGMFVNTLGIRNYPDGEKTFSGFLQEVKEIILASFENQDYPFEDLVETVAVNRDAGRNPLFDVMFILQNMNRTGFEIPGLKLRPYDYDNRTSKFDLTLNGVELENSLQFTFEYCTKLFKVETIERFTHYFRKIISSVIKDTGQKIGEIDIIPGPEKQLLLYEFNNTYARYPKDKTLHQLFEEQVERTPDNKALVGHQEPFGQMQLSYRELNEKSNQLAHLLNKKGVQSDTIVGIMVERSLEMIIGILGILKAGGAFLPIDPDYPHKRIKFMLTDSRAKVLVTTHELFMEDGKIKRWEDRKLGNWIDDKIFLNVGNMLACFENQPATGSPQPAASPFNLCYVIYTSGSTGKPRGILIGHGNVVNFIKGITSRIAFETGKSILALTTISFDIFVLETLLPLTRGLKVIIANKQQHSDPELLKKIVNNNHIEMVQVTPSRLQLMLENPGCLWGVKVLMVGGEAFPGNLFRRLPGEFNGQVYNLYGPTETTVWSTLKDLTAAGAEEITIGGPISNTRVFILDRNHRLQPIGAAGELCIGGDGVARGYLNNPELTFERFINYKLQQITNKEVPGERIHMSYMSYIYRTGDLACWLQDGNIEFLGRIDHQVKIRGFRIELGEIESHLLKHDQIKEAVVISREDETGDKYLSAYIVSNHNIPVSQLREYLLEHLPEYMVPAYFIRLEKMPLTPNGKINRNALPEPGFTTGKSYTAPGNKIEEKLVKMWQEVLGRDEKIGIHDNFFHLGGHSLKATILISRVHKELDVHIPLSEFFKTPVIRGLGEYIRNVPGNKFVSIEPVEKKDRCVLSSGQKRLYLLEQLEPGSISYNLPFVLELEGKVDTKKLEQAFRMLISRHESLRTSSEIIGEEPIQAVHEGVEFAIEYYDMKEVEINVEDEQSSVNSKSLEAFINSFVRPFDLSKAPLLRVGLIRHTPALAQPSQEGSSQDKHILLTDIHHLITDGRSQVILIEEFMLIYSGKELSPLRIQYKDYAEWQQSQAIKEELQLQEKYWLDEFQGEIPVLDIPLDFPRPAQQSFEGSILDFEISIEETKALNKITYSHQATLFMVVLAIYNVFLSKLSSQEDIIVGSPVAGRRHADLEHIVGMFVNTLALRNYPSGEKTFKDFLKEIKAHTLEAFENQDYPFEDLVGEVAVQRDMSRNPLFDVVFVLQNVFTASQAISEKEIGGLKIKKYDTEHTTSKFDLTLSANEVHARLHLSFNYCTKLFREETILRFISYFKAIISWVVENPEKKIFQIEIVTKEEKDRILYDFNDTENEYPKDKTIHQLFADQAEKKPDHIALVGVHETHEKHEKNYNMSYLSHMFYMSYKELNEKSHQLAHLLQSKGLKPGTIVGIMTERSVEMIIGIFSILKAGGAYLPIDPHYPEKRIQYILTDSNARVLLTDNHLSSCSSWLSSLNCELLTVTDQLSAGHSSNHHLHLQPATVTSLAYIIYTSGSTGKPKGIMVEHRNAVNLVYGLNEKIYKNYNEGLKVCLFAPYVFDASVKQIFAALLLGHSLYIVPDETRSDGERVLQFYKKHQIDISDGTPSHLQLILEAVKNSTTGTAMPAVSPVKHFLIGGEELPRKLARDFLNTFEPPGPIITNVYGPTECTVDTTSFDVTLDYLNLIDTVPIGAPLGNLSVYILDSNNNLQPGGVPGELYIAGDGVGRGYLNNPGLTAEKFDHDFGDYRDYQDDDQKFLRGPGAVFSKRAPGRRRPRGAGSLLKVAPLSPEFYPRPYAPGSRRLRIYKSGDLARWLPDGNLEFLGRIDHQVKIRGFRVELGEIENQLLKHRQVKEAVVLAKEDKTGDKYLCVYIVSNVPASVDSITAKLRKHLSAALPDYMIPSYFVSLENIPLTPSGKMNRKALPDPEFKVGDDHEAPGNEIEIKLLGIWSDVLGIEKEKISIHDNFFELGGHSLKATLLAAKIDKELSVKVPLAAIFRNSTIRKLAGFIKGLKKDKHAAIEPVEQKEFYPLSFAQKRLYFLWQMDSTSTSYNLPRAMIIEGKLDKKSFEMAFRALISRHEALRTSFHLVDRKPIQKIHEKVEFEIEYPDTGNRQQAIGNSEGLIHTAYGLKPDSFIKDFSRPFDLTHAPLLRVGLMETGQDRYLLLLDKHHIITDGVTEIILIREFIHLCEGENLGQLPLQYKDYSQWQNKQLETGEINRQKEYWLNRFNSKIPILNMHTDYRRQAAPIFHGDKIPEGIGPGLTGKIKDLTMETDTTLFMVLLAAWYILLSKYTNQEDITVGIPAAGRNHPDLEYIAGMFVNTLAMRNYPGKERNFTDFLQEVKTNALEAYENQVYPFDDLVHQLDIPRNSQRNPLFDVLFVSENLDMPELAVKGLRFRPYPFEHPITHMDLVLYFIEAQETIHLILEYSTALFKKETAKRMLKHYTEILTQVVENRRIALKDITISHKFLTARSTALQEEDVDFIF